MQELGMCLMVVGIILGIVGWKRNPRNMPLTISGAFLAIGGILIGTSGELMPGIVISAVSVIGTIISIMNIVNLKKDALLEIGGTNLDKFFVECVFSSCNEMKSEKTIARAKLLADKYNLKYPNGIQELYNEALKAHEQISKKLDEKIISNLRIADEEEFNELNKYSDLVGKAKRIQMLTDEMQNMLTTATQIEKTMNTVINSSQQKELNWATWGGIADGIAGPGAGIATAVDVQINNAKIRQQNEAAMDKLMPAYMHVTNNANQLRSNAKAIQEEIRDFQTKLTCDIPAEKLFEKLSFSETDISVSDCGSVKITTMVELNEKFKIFDDVPAVIDGTIIGKIYSGDTLKGTAQLVLPLYGIGKKTQLKGICLSDCKKGTNYTVKFVPKHLWALEK